MQMNSIGILMPADPLGVGGPRRLVLVPAPNAPLRAQSVPEFVQQQQQQPFQHSVPREPALTQALRDTMVKTVTEVPPRAPDGTLQQCTSFSVELRISVLQFLPKRAEIDWSRLARPAFLRRARGACACGLTTRARKVTDTLLFHIVASTQARTHFLKRHVILLSVQASELRGKEPFCLFVAGPRSAVPRATVVPHRLLPRPPAVAAAENASVPAVEPETVLEIPIGTAELRQRARGCDVFESATLNAHPQSCAHL